MEVKAEEKTGRKERVQALRLRLRLGAAELLLEENLEGSVLLGLAATLPFLRVQEEIAQALDRGDPTRAVGLAGLVLLGRKMEPLKGTWPGSRGWFFLDPFMEETARNGEREHLLNLSRIALSAPLFLAATVAAALDTWGTVDPRSKLLAQVVAQKATPMVRGMAERLDWILGPGPR